MLLYPRESGWFSTIIIKTSGTGPSGKRSFRNPTSTRATKNWLKHIWMKQPTVDCTIQPIQHSGDTHSLGKVIPHSNLSRQKTSWYFKLVWMSCGYFEPGSRWKLDEQWFEFELTLYNYIVHQHAVDDTTTRSSDSNSGIREAEGDIQQLSPTLENNIQGLREQIYNSNDVTGMCP